MKQGMRDTIPTHERDVESGSGGYVPLQHDSGNPHAFGPPLGVTSVPRVVKAERTEQHLSCAQHLGVDLGEQILEICDEICEKGGRVRGQIGGSTTDGDGGAGWSLWCAQW